jgi:hypothetical protein
MSSPVGRACLVLLLGIAASPVRAQATDTTLTPPDAPVLTASSPVADDEPPVLQYDLSGPRIGVTFMPHGLGPRTQFGWHFENQAAPGTRGPWFLVERIFLIGGVERSEFIPSGTLIFGFRTPGSFEFGVGPSVTIGSLGTSTAIVVAAGQTLRYGGIRVPLNVALAMSQRQNVTSYRVTLITGWAIRQPKYERRREPYDQDRPFGAGPGR